MDPPRRILALIMTGRFAEREDDGLVELAELVRSCRRCDWYDRRDRCCMGGFWSLFDQRFAELRTELHNVRTELHNDNTELRDELREVAANVNILVGRQQERDRRTAD